MPAPGRALSSSGCWVGLREPPLTPNPPSPPPSTQKMKMYFEMLPGLPLTKELQQLAASPSPPSAGNREISVELRDVSEPLPLALPKYGGNAYIYGAVVMGGVWMFSTVPLLVMYGVVLVRDACACCVAVGLGYRS